jgi:stage III sporulation protein AG
VKWSQWLEQLFGSGRNGKKRVQTMGWLIIIGLIGFAAMIMNAYVTVKDADSLSNTGSFDLEPVQEAFGESQKQNSEFEQFEARYEARMKEILEKIVGVGQVDILVTIEATEELVAQQNQQQSQQVTNEKDQDGGTRQITDMNRSGEVVLYQSSGNQSPVIIKKIKPKIRGVVVVASGAENLVVKKLIVEAVERGLGAPAHRISVIPRKQ